MALYSFGSGILVGTRTDIANATPVNFGVVQDVELDESADLKEAHGQFTHAIAQGRGKTKSTGKASVVTVSGLAFANLYYGIVPSSGYTATQFQEAGTIPSPSGPYTVTVANSANFADDDGVNFLTTGLPLTKVASGPAAGQYSVSAGVYTFAAADAGKAVLITYTYTVSASGQKLVVTNQLMGDAPVFQALFYTRFQGKQISVKLNACISTKLSFKTKLDDFTMPNFEFGYFADASGTVMTWNFPEVS